MDPHHATLWFFFFFFWLHWSVQLQHAGSPLYCWGSFVTHMDFLVGMWLYSCDTCNSCSNDMWGLSTRDSNLLPLHYKQQILNHWTTREIPALLFLDVRPDLERPRFLQDEVMV